MKNQSQHLKRLADYFKENGKKQDDLCTDLGVTQPYISAIISGKKTIGRRTAEKLSELYGLSYSWLLTGEGDMLAKQPTANAQHTEGNNNTNVIGDNNNVANNVTITRAHAHANNNIIEVHEDTKPIVPKYLASKPNTDVYQVIKQGQIANLTTLKTMPPYQDFDFYYQVRQDAMQPLYMQGDVLALVHVSDGSDIVQGAAMVVDTKDYGFMLRRLYDRGDCYECKRINEESAFENQKVAKDKVIRLYRVVYSVRLGD